MGATCDEGSQHAMWVATADLPQGGGHPFYERLNEILCAAGFDAFVERLCARCYSRMERPSLAPAASERDMALPTGVGTAARQRCPKRWGTACGTWALLATGRGTSRRRTGCLSIPCRRGAGFPPVGHGQGCGVRAGAGPRKCARARHARPTARSGSRARGMRGGRARGGDPAGGAGADSGIGEGRGCRLGPRLRRRRGGAGSRAPSNLDRATDWGSADTAQSLLDDPTVKGYVRGYDDRIRGSSRVDDAADELETLTVTDETPTVRAIWISRWRWSRNAVMRVTMRTGVVRGCRWGRAPRSARPSGPFSLIPGDPPAHGARTDAPGGGDEVHWQLVGEHAGDQLGSTRGGGSGILMDVHSVLRLERVIEVRRKRARAPLGRLRRAAGWRG